MNIDTAKTIIVKTLAIMLYPFILQRWQKNKNSFYNLNDDSKRDYFLCSARYFLKFFRFPDLEGDSLNDVIFRMKIIDRNPIKIKCCDKVAVREHIKDKLSDHYLPDLYWSSNNITSDAWERLPKNFVLKTNHNSGCVIVVKDKSKMNFDSIKKQVSKSLNQQYGEIEGEWPYRYVFPQVFAEELLLANASLPADYKLHCYKGMVKWIQYISEREKCAKELIISRDGNLIEQSLSPDMKKGGGFSIPSNWVEMIQVAEKLAVDFDYVRIDMYSVNDKIYFGEITFSPLAGLYQLNTSNKFGRMLTK